MDYKTARMQFGFSIVGWLLLNVLPNAFGIVALFWLGGVDLFAIAEGRPWFIAALLICMVLLLALLSSAAQSALHLYGREFGKAVIGFLLLMGVDLAINGMGLYGGFKPVAWPLDWSFYGWMVLLAAPFNIGCEWYALWLLETGKLNAPAPREIPAPKQPSSPPLVMGPRRAATRRTR
jgi:hypothetical protein